MSDFDFMQHAAAVIFSRMLHWEMIPESSHATGPEAEKIHLAARKAAHAAIILAEEFELAVRNIAKEGGNHAEFRSDAPGR